MTRKKFKPVENNLDFSKQEKQILDWWYKSDVVKNYLNKNRQKQQIFSFIDGPITANNPMGVHHARGRTIKDVFQRYKNFQGFKQRFQNGFDCQGLWVEVEVEKSQGFNSKKDIIDFGIDNFTNACKARVEKYAAIQTEQSKRLGMFMDWPNSYYTMSETNNLYIWYFLKKLNDRKLLYKQKTATTWCPRCETGLSQHEQADGYKTIDDVSVYVKFKLKNRSNEFVLAWTTTPWTLAANVLLAINTTYEYVKVKYDGQILYMAKLSADRLGFKDQRIIDPKTLLNLEYENLIDIPAQKNINHKIVLWDLVNPQEGSGVVHIAPGCGQEDYELGISLKSDIIEPIDSTGYFKDGFGFLTGKNAHHVKQQVIDHLQSLDVLYKTETISHRYPHCWRCGTKCLFKLEDNWFISCDPIKPLLKLQTEEANWIPKYAKKRMLNWLNNMGDWMISRKRFYGLSLPFYETNKGELFVVGSKEELKKLAVNPQKVDKLPSLHRPWIDDIEIKHPQTGEIMHRIADVGDCWLDAGVVPFSTLKYLEDKSYWQKWFPADLVCEMIEQVRLWFYSMLFYGVVLEEKIPYKNVLNYYEVRDEKRERMSKTKGNGIPYDQAVETMTADAMRWLYCKSKSHSVVNFGYNLANDVKRGFISTLWNSYKYYISFASLNQPTDKFKPQIIDDWLISRLNHTIKLTTHFLDKYDTSRATETIENFINDFSTWYIRRCRDRIDNHQILHFTLDNLIKLIAPITPFISESIFQNLSGNNFTKAISIHHQDWPKFDQKLINLNLEKDMNTVRLVCQLIHAQRQAHQIKVRQPLNQATVSINQKQLDKKLIDLICQETNIKKLVWSLSKNQNITVNLDTNITKELKSEGDFRDLSRQIQIIRKEMNLLPTDKIKIFAPNWPKAFELELLSKTNAVSISKSNQLKIEKI